MKSTTLTLGFSDTFFEDLARFSALPEGVIVEASTLIESAEVDGIVRQDELIPLAKSSNLTLDNITRGISAAIHLMERALDQKDDLDAVLYDLVALGRAPDSSSLKRRLLLLDAVIKERLLKMRTHQDAIASAFPVMTSFQASVAMVFSFEKGSSRRADRLATYRPEVSGAVPVVVLQFDIDDFGSDNQFSFACSLAGLSDLIKRLELAKKEAISVRAYEHHADHGEST